MKSKVNFETVSIDPKLVYIRSVKVEDLPEQVQEQAEGRETLYAVHDGNGAPLALVAERALAFSIARQNDLSPVTVH